MARPLGACTTLVAGGEKAATLVGGTLHNELTPLCLLTRVTIIVVGLGTPVIALENSQLIPLLNVLRIDQVKFLLEDISGLLTLVSQLPRFGKLDTSLFYILSECDGLFQLIDIYPLDSNEAIEFAESLKYLSPAIGKAFMMYRVL